MLTGTIFDIKRYALYDGPGIRTTVFLKGCPLACWWCHNPESQAPETELLIRANRCTRCGACAEICPQDAIYLEATTSMTDRTRCERCGRCVETCFSGARDLVGREIPLAELLREVERDTPFHDASGGGVTFSGGEPLLQAEFLAAALSACRERDIHTVVDTCGYAPWEAFEGLRRDVQLFLYDLKLLDDDRHVRYMGVSNALILRNLRILSERGARIIVRVPLIPGVNDDVESLQQLGAFMASLPQRHPVELLRYHDIAGAKYAALGREYLLAGVPVPAPEALEAVCRTLEACGIEVRLPQ